jgi:hypothetical protein
MIRIVLIAAFAFATTMQAASPQDFAVAAAESAKKATTRAGDQYGVKFVQTASKSVARAMSSCDRGDFAIGSTCDLVFIISASGRIERVLQGQPSPFAKCIVSHLQMPKTIAKPPSAHWPLHVRIIHGHPKEPMNPLIMFFADNADAKR